jgi:DNA-binding Lrp family transcriptional regulator
MWTFLDSSLYFGDHLLRPGDGWGAHGELRDAQVYEPGDERGIGGGLSANSHPDAGFFGRLTGHADELEYSRVVGSLEVTQAEEGLLLLAEVARLYYVKNLTQGHIAERIGTSRSNVSRMLKEARARGLVEIRINAPLTAATDLQKELRGRLDLRECLVLANPRIESDIFTPADRVGRMSALGARYLQENVPDGAVVGVSWSSTVHHVVSSRYLQEKNGATAVQLMGSSGVP